MNPIILSLALLTSVPAIHAMIPEADLLTPNTQQSRQLIRSSEALITAIPNTHMTSASSSSSSSSVDTEMSLFFNNTNDTPEAKRHRIRTHLRDDGAERSPLSQASLTVAEAQENLARTLTEAGVVQELGELQHLSTIAQQYQNVAEQAERARVAGTQALLTNARTAHAQLSSAIQMLEQALQSDPALLTHANGQAAEDSEEDCSPQAADEEEEKVYAATVSERGSDHQHDAATAPDTTNVSANWNRALANFKRTAQFGLALGCVTGGGAAISERLLTSACGFDAHDAQHVCIPGETLVRLAWQAMLSCNADKYHIPYPELQIPVAWFGSWAMYLLLSNNAKTR